MTFCNAHPLLLRNVTEVGLLRGSAASVAIDESPLHAGQHHADQERWGRPTTATSA